MTSSDNEDENGNYDMSQTKKFLSVCKKCEDMSEDDIIAKLNEIVSKCQNGFSSINFNYENPTTGDFALKYIIKYLKPNVLTYIMDNFNDNIDWMIIDNRNLNNNVLHYLIADLNYKSKEDMKSAIHIINIIFKLTSIDEIYKDEDDDNKDSNDNSNENDSGNGNNDVGKELSSWDQLLYQKNEYNLTPMEYAQKKNMFALGKELEIKLFSHVSQLLITQCHVPHGVAVVIIGYTFEFYHLWKFNEKLYKKLNQ